jgi:hypothetical protein
VRDLAVVHFIKTYLREHEGSKDKAAIYAAKEHFKIGRATAYSIWESWLDRVLNRRPTK